jgi:hypothetical protein
VRGHCPTHGAPIPHVGISVHVLDDLGASLTDAKMSAREAQGVLSVSVAHHAVLVSISDTSTATLNVLVVVNLVDLVLSIFVDLIIAVAFVALCGLATTVPLLVQAVNLFDDLERGD